MKRARLKLQSSSGASMIIALLFLLLCLTVGAIMLSAASSSAGRMRTARTNQQNYLTVSSASDILRDKISGLKFTGIEKSVYDSKGNTITFPAPTYTYSSAEALPTLIFNKAKQVFIYQSSFTPSGLMPAAIPLQITSNGFENVTANMTVQSDYSLRIVVYPTALPSSYPLTLTVPASLDSTSTIDISPYTVTETINGVSTVVQYVRTTTTHTVNVTWGSGAITLGS